MNQPTDASLPIDAQALRDRDILLSDFHQTRNMSIRMTSGLEVEDQVIQTCEEVSPTKWHLAHTTWFFETFILRPYADAYTPFNEQYEFLFNSYYNSVGPQFYRPERGFLSRPTVKEIHDYRAHVDEAVDRCIRGMYEVDWLIVANILETGIHHEQQHQELILTDIKEVLSHNPLAPAPFAPPSQNRQISANEMSWTSFDGGLVTIGTQIDPGNFAYDNEGPPHQHYLKPFALADKRVTNGEFLNFMADGGYRDPLLWLSDGWSACQSGGWKSPHHWRHIDDAWHQYTLHGLKPVDENEPVSHISFFEANAFATWQGSRLPTEFEWEHAAGGDLPQGGNFFDCVENAEGRIEAPTPMAATASNPGMTDIFGSVWEWTQSPYTPYPSYEPVQGALGEYNGKFMCNQFVLRGGSCATPRGHIRTTYRNFFPPQSRWQFAGLRLAKDI